LTDFIDQPVKTFSSGMYARLAFSVAINVDPDILIVDETLAVGDARFVAKCMRRIKRIQTEGATILFVSHDVSSVRTLCERAIWLDNGKMVEDGNVFPVTGRYVEYMFKDDSPQSDVISLENEDEPHRETFAGLVAADSERSPEHEEPYNRAPLPRPITHWGSHKGLIQSAFLKSETYGLNSDVLSYGEYMEITIELDIPETITRECLAVAVSIKDLKGTDLIVSTTQDLNHTVLPREERFSVTFRLKNMLAAGQFLLVAAVERRSLLDCHYYEYIEGIRYFSSVSDSRLFGVFHPDVLRNIAVHQ
jgi:lipopolysaccharide transport system ATP-binding protein